MASNTRGRIACLNGTKNVELKEFDVPSPGPDAIVTEIVRANVCGSELHMWRGGHPKIDDGPLGHEGLCRIVELGENVTTDNAGRPVEEGDLIVPTYFAICESCTRCGAGEFRLCEHAYDHWSQSADVPPHFHGTFASHYYVYPDQFFYKVPPELDEGPAASANCALAQVLGGLDAVDVGWGDTVVVQGAGGLGLNTVAAASERGAETIVIDGVADRLDLAERFGADHTVDLRTYDSVEQRAERVRELTGGDGADVGVEVAGVPEAFAEGIELLRAGGRYLEMGNVVPGHTTEFDPGAMTRKSIDVRSVMRYDPWYLRTALEFLHETGDDYPFEELVGEGYPLDEVDAAIRRSDERDVARASLVPE
ncbi:zinc-binding dehydrogenase [Haloplanus pelagicus]|jgi:threonine dehydrogenase-like Zn-dependent dehydrogenase|uniref:zinc-binding dehydrogenase n=1 Tax=Haloplanus pelagicus TaxID=2949995 RepID=UPI00203CFEED|nr:zinc-binding dehydrogenase [Haloplanus sp. HW8-1]